MTKPVRFIYHLIVFGSCLAAAFIFTVKTVLAKTDLLVSQYDLIQIGDPESRVAEVLGLPTGQFVRENVTIYSYDNPETAWPNLVVTENGKINSIQVFYGSETKETIVETLATLGEPEKTADSDFSANALAYLFPTKGITVIADKTNDRVIMKQRYTPIVSQNLQVWGFDLVEGWNFISLPNITAEIKTAKSLINYINSQGGFVTTVAKWDREEWQEVTVRQGERFFGKDFPLSELEAYFVRSHKDSKFILPKQKLTRKSSFSWISNLLEKLNIFRSNTLKPGWYAVGGSGLRQQTAQGILAGVNKTQESSGREEKIPEIARWDFGLWTNFIQRIYSSNNIQEYGLNFPISNMEGYFLRVEKPVDRQELMRSDTN